MRPYERPLEASGSRSSPNLLAWIVCCRQSLSSSTKVGLGSRGWVLGVGEDLTAVACACRSTGKAYQGFCVRTSAFPPASFRAHGARYYRVYAKLVHKGRQQKN